MQIHTIQSFVMLCHEKNISKCSQKLHISQQGLSRQIKSLETELGVTLFTRNTKGVELTKEGEILLQYFEPLLDTYQTGMQELRKYQNKTSEVLRVSVCPGIKNVLGLDFFVRFQKEHPGMRLKLEFKSDVDCEEDLYTEKADAAFLDWPVHENEYDSHKIIESPLVAVMNRNHPLSNKSALHMQDLYGMHIYIPDESHRMTQLFKEHRPDVYDSVIIDITANEYDDFFHQLPKNDDGIALTFQFLCDQLDPELVALPFVEDSYVSLSYCVKKSRKQTKALKAFSEYVKNAVIEL